jgi:peptidoglycan/LPS O-acetylase OafA/YrhL
MLGVGVFFTLSGYLITDLLLGHWRRHGALGLGVFWRRRARRLLPALFLMLVVVSVWVGLFDAAQLPAFRRQVLAAIIYMSNWATIAQHGSYFARFAAPRPLDHLWSLAIEEQFYLLWPSVLLLGIWTARNRWRLALLTLGLAAVSALVMALVHHPGYDPTRAYEGTDTRAFGLLIGAALAMVWPTRVARTAATPAARDLLDALGVAGLLGIGLLVWRTNSFSVFLYPYGFVLLSIATAVVVAAAVNPASRLGAVLGCAPLRWVGVRSYGIYLWQWPVIVLASPARGPLNWSRAALEVAGTVTLASLSWRYVEEPVRRGAIERLWERLRPIGAQVSTPRRLCVIWGSVLAAIFIPVVSVSGLLSAPPARGAAANVLGHALATAARGYPSIQAPRIAAVVRPVRALASTQTSCRSVVYIGDSTSEGEISPDYIPDPRRRLAAQLADVGVNRTVAEISGARSIVETYDQQPNAATVARQLVAEGFHGCWILALGTNDAADVRVGSQVGLSTRIARMMSIIGQQPALWVEAVTLVQSGPYAEAGMQTWNQDLAQACPEHPSMRTFDWPAAAKPQWFIPDGIHYYSLGYTARAHLIARGLAHAFPADAAPAPHCLVR